MNEFLRRFFNQCANQGKEPLSVVLPGSWFIRLADELEIKPIPATFHFLGVSVRMGLDRFEAEFKD